jgi:hypothetical protein
MERIKLVHKTFLPPATDEGKWIEVQEAPEGSHAEVLFNGGLPLVADFVLTSDSGDWVLFATYYFRRDGSLAQQQERLNTFYGNAQVLRARVFGCGGKLLKSRSEHRDLKSKKLKKAEPEFIDERAPRIRNTGDLPFPW